MKLPTLLLAALAASPAFAQFSPPATISPGALQQQRIDEEERRRQIERMERPTVADPLKEVAPPPPAVRSEPGGQVFFVREIHFSPSEIFTPDELQAFASPYQGRDLTLADLQTLVGEINAAYRSRHIVTAQATLPPQNVSRGVVEIRLIEGRVGKIDLHGNATTRDSYITGRIGQGPGDLVDLPTLERDLDRFNRTNDVQLQVSLAPGSAFGTTDFRIEAVEPPRHEFRFFADNNGSISTGEWRGGLSYFNHSLLGYRDEFSLSTTQANGLQSYSVGYSLPVNTLGGRLSFNLYQDETRILQGPYASLNLTGESTSGVLTLRQPVYFGKTSQINLLLATKQRRTTNWISDVFLQRTETNDGSLGFEVQKTDDHGYWFATYSYTMGQAESAGTTHYEVGRGMVMRNENLANDWSARGTFNFQHTPKDILTSAEQMMIGGEGSVRGYPVGTYSGESGFGASLELHHPLGTLGKLDSSTAITARGFFFIDYSRVDPYRPPATLLSKHEELTSLGWGINASLGKNISSRVTLAYTPNDIPTRSSDYFIHFQIMASVF